MKYEEFLFTETGKRQFVLSEESISVTGKGFNVTLMLRGLEPEYRTIRRRTPAFVAGLLCLCLGLVGAAALPWFVDLASSYIAVLGAVFGLWLSICTSRKVERTVFKNTTGINAISIARAGPDSSTFDQFVDELSRRIRQAKDQEGDVVLPDQDPDGSDARMHLRAFVWLISFVAGWGLVSLGIRLDRLASIDRVDPLPAVCMILGVSLVLGSVILLIRAV